MPERTVPARGMANVRTMAGKGGRLGDACSGYMRISFLELERARRQQEMHNAEQAIRRIAARIREIDTEKQTILNGCEDRLSEGAPPSPPRAAPGRHAARGAISLRY